jgi:hypothetical protein
MKRRLVDPTPAWKRCAWLNDGASANAIQQCWLAYGLLCVGLWNALGLPELDLRHPGAGCLVETVIIEREAA